jgi:plasmid stabilization system protein ParE
VAEVVYSARALENLARAMETPHAGNTSAAIEVLDAIESGVANLSAHPLVGRRVEDDLRELVISFGETGYVALYRFVLLQDAVRILALRHQREIGFLP